MRSLLPLLAVTLAPVATLATPAAAQSPAQLDSTVRAYVAVSDSVVALANVTLIDGTGRAPQARQTILIRGGRIAEVGPAGKVKAPKGARTLDLAGHTVIPGIVGMHDHLFYTAAGRRANQMSFTGPRLYLGSGVTTIRTTGGRSPYAEINLRTAVESGHVPGPRIHITAPYITGGTEGGAGSMAAVNTPEAARRFVAYWGQEGATWVKAYTDIHRAELGAAIEEAHKHGMKVTGHLCSVSFREAVDLGIDNLEHGLLTATDMDSQKQPDVCPENSVRRVAATRADSTWNSVFRAMLDHKVAMTSTLVVYETFFPHRPVTDQRVLDMMTPAVRDAYMEYRAGVDTAQSPALTPEMLKNAMAFEKAFADAGGLLGAGVDPTGIGGALPGFGDQRNFELLREAGFTAPQAVQIMTLNGAKILGVADSLGSVERGKVADLVVLQGDLAADPATIRRPVTVFKGGVGYDSAKLIEAAKGRVGID